MTEYQMKEKTAKKNNALLIVARKLRKEMTPQEKHIWYDFLRFYPMKVYKQRIIGNFVADFYCHKARLVIEIDGAQHYTPKGKSHDEARTEAIEKYGISVIRFTNGDVDTRFEAVCKAIDRAIIERVAE